MNSNTEKSKVLSIILIFAILYALFFPGKTSSQDKIEKPSHQANDHTSTIPSSSKESSSKPKNSLDPYDLSFTDRILLFDSDLRNILSSSPLEYCSHVIEKNDTDLTLTWNLKSTGKEVYRCEYSYDRNRTYSQRSLTTCQIGEAYQDYLDGDRALIRDYVMPQKDDEIDMFVYENRSSYYEKYFILGKYSDMICRIEGDDILFEYSWYQDTEDGPVLVYRSTARNTVTTTGKRYNDAVWELFEESKENIDIIPYEEYPRKKDYFEVYHQWENKNRETAEAEAIAETIEIYCACTDEEDLYSEYMDDFDSWEEALEFWEEYCE